MPTEIMDDPLAQCADPEHNPPRHIVIPTGKMMRHTCPSCGKVTVVRRGGSRPWDNREPVRPVIPFTIEPYPEPVVYRTDPNRPPWERPIVRFGVWGV